MRFPRPQSHFPSFDVNDPDTGAPLRSADSLFDVAVDPTTGTLYAVWQDARFSGFAHESVAFSMSKDGGFNWSEPVQINRTPSDLRNANQQAFVPSIAVNRKGMLAITYYDFRFNGAEPEALTDHWAITCRPKAKRDCSDPEDWSELRLTPESFDIRKAPNAGGSFLGDYDGLAAGNNSVIAAFSVSSDTDPANLIYGGFKRASSRRTNMDPRRIKSSNGSSTDRQISKNVVEGTSGVPNAFAALGFDTMHFARSGH
jgi:hypothetical protein